MDGIHDEYLHPVLYVSEECDLSARMGIAFLLFEEARANVCGKFYQRNHFDVTLGALPDHNILQTMVDASPRSLSDFDRFTLERELDGELWNTFCDWKNSSAAAALTYPVIPGDTLIAESGSFLRLHVPTRSPILPCPLPADDVAVLTRYPREADLFMVTLLESDRKTLSFQVNQVIRSGWKKWSQVYSGVVSDEHGRNSTTVCLKLFDERLFPPPSYRDDLDPLHPLYNWNTAEEMAQREEAAYERLIYLQGTLLPHSYGFHYVCPHLISARHLLICCIVYPA